MRRIFVFLSFICVLANSAYAQLLVESNGNVAIKPTTDPIVSDFAVNYPGYSEITSYIMSNSDYKDISVRIFKEGTANTGHDYTTALKSSVAAKTNSTKKAFGVYAHAYKETATDTNIGRSYGLYSLAGNGASGYNYGVFGTLYGNNNGAGVYGSSVSSDGGISTGSRYAGFFRGDVKSTDAMYATAFNTPSDFRFKENIESVGSESTDGLMKLNVVKYNLKQFAVETGDTATVQEYYYTDDSNILERKHYGLIAQELQQIYPDLVYEGKDGYLSVNYMEIIPILIKKIQELELKVEKLDNAPSKAAMRNAVTTTVSDIESLPILYQNDPNPFTENTTIKCVIPNSIRSALLYIYDMNGRQIDGIIIKERGDISVTISANSLDAGMYLYSLITDGVASDTKRMILTR